MMDKTISFTQLNLTRSKRMFERSIRLLVLAGTAAFLAAPCLVARADDNTALPTIPAPSIPDKTFKITDYGAVADGQTLCTDAISKAIDACSKAGGGTVLVPAGKFLTGPFTLVSNMDFKVDQGATLVFSDDPSLYAVSEDSSHESSEGNGRRYQNFIQGNNLHDIALTGSGTIDGQGLKWWMMFMPFKKKMSDPAAPPHRPLMISLNNCQRVDVEGLTLKDSPMFHLVPQACQDVLISGLNISASPTSPNTDGIDPSGSNYLIKNCTIDTGDDNIALKPVHAAIPGHPACENFLVTDCTFKNGHGMSIGGQTPGGLKHLVVRNCTFDQTQNGIRMKAPRGNGGLVEDCTYENLTMDGVEHPITISSFYPLPKGNNFGTTQPVDTKTPIWRDIHITNVTATESDYGGEIFGLPEMHITDMTLTNVKISATRPLRIANADGIKFVNCEIDATNGQPVVLTDATIDGLDPTTGK
jgi:polygalacturonase